LYILLNFQDIYTEVKFLVRKACEKDTPWSISR